MLSKTTQLEYFRDRCMSILHHCEKFEKRINEEDLHRIRVDLKKVRLLLFLERKIHGRKHKRERKMIDGLFRSAGKIREAQVNMQLVRHEKAGDARFFLEQKEMEKQSAEKFISTIHKKASSIVEAHAQLWKSFSSMKRKPLLALKDELLGEIRSAVYPVLRKRNLHDARKQMKRLIYLHSLLKKKDAEKLGLDTEALRLLEEEIGKWHDTVIAAPLLKKFPRSNAIRVRLKKRGDLHLQRAKKHVREIFGA